MGLGIIGCFDLWLRIKEQVLNVSNNSQLDTFNTYTYRYYIRLKSERQIYRNKTKFTEFIR